LRINRWLLSVVVAVAAIALFIDSYTYIFRASSHIGFERPLRSTEVPTFLGKELFIHKGLDLQGGTEIMTKRVNGIGVSEAQVQAQGDKRVLVQLPGVDFDRARQLVGKTARLTFRTWQKAAPGPDGKLPVPKDATGDPVVDPSYVPIQEGGTCTGSLSKECIPPGYLPKETGIDGSMIVTATSGFDNTRNEPVVDITLTEQGSSLLGQVTTPLASAPAGTPENQLTIFLDNTMVNNAGVEGVLSGGSFQIHGGRISSDAPYRNDLIATLNAGRLPGKVSIVEANSVGATLGFDSVRRAFLAGGLGLAAVVIFMIGYYRLPGVVASLALAFYAAVTLATFKLIPVTLTLAGMAGFVLSVGMAVDANVLIFERLREELRNGRSLAAAVEAAHTRALPAIRDSNISTLITCAVLYLQDRIPGLVGFTQAKGFGLTLGIGVAVSFVSAVIVTQIILQLVIRIQRFRTPTLYAVERMQ
jgi:preprotein translocase subunit SecD